MPVRKRSVAWNGPHRGVARIAALTMLLCAAPLAAFAAAPWHDDLGRAREAARVSRRPVLAIFTATWQPGAAAVADTVLGTPDAKALVSACFEPVLIDVDQHADLTRRLGIKHVPTAAVLDERDELLATFACPTTTPEFVVAAAQAAQQASAQRQRLEDTGRRPGAAALAEAGAPAGAAGTQASISVVSSKVRQLSDFASHDQSGVPAQAPATVAAYQQPTQTIGQHVAGVAAANQAVAEQSPPVQDTPFPHKPPAWPAETPFAPLTSTIAGTPPARPALEPMAAGPPVAVPQAVPTTPWLGTVPQKQAVDEPESSASVSDLPATKPGPQATVTSPKPTPGAQFIAALQKPFAGFARKPVTPPATVLSPPAAPPTMAPARPQWPAAGLATTTPRAGGPVTPPAAQAAPSMYPPAAQPAAAQPVQVAAQPQPAAAAPGQESMPLGLEGYCPVTLAAKGAWAEGRADYGVRHRGRTYLFAGAAEQQTFLADPDRYAPALSGDDPVIAFEQGRSMPGQRRYGVKCDARMYLFSSPETRAAFQAQPERYKARIAQAEQLGPTGTRTY